MIIGILTFQQAINYGAVLQLYALQKQLKKFNIEIEVINYISPELEKNVKLVKLGRGLKSFIASIITLNSFRVKKVKFRKFIKKYMCLSAPIFQKQELYTFSQKYDYIITGSDQVWNYQITKNDSTYLLDFINPCKRISYAASFGVSELPARLCDNYNRILKDFKYITVREEQGAKIINDLCEMDVPVVLDPTLLLKKEEWKEITSATIGLNKKIVVYTLSPSTLLLKYAEELSKETGFEIAVLNPGVRNMFKSFSVASAGPEEFVETFLNAKYILTNSFHGTVFAVNFNKKFIVELPKGEGGQRNSRIENILDLLNLKDRCIESLDLAKMYADIDWDKVNSILDVERKKSVEHLKKMIGKNE